MHLQDKKQAHPYGQAWINQSGATRTRATKQRARNTLSLATAAAPLVSRSDWLGHQWPRKHDQRSRPCLTWASWLSWTCTWLVGQPRATCSRYLYLLLQPLQCSLTSIAATEVCWELHEHDMHLLSYSINFPGIYCLTGLGPLKPSKA